MAAQYLRHALLLIILDDSVNSDDMIHQCRFSELHLGVNELLGFLGLGKIGHEFSNDFKHQVNLTDYPSVATVFESAGLAGNRNSWYFTNIIQLLMAQTTSIDILNMLVEAGLDRQKAEPIAKEIITRSEAVATLSTKSDVVTMSAEIGLVKARLNMLIGINIATFVAILTLVVERIV